MKNIILVTGPISDGKSVLIHRFQDELVSRKISQALGVISDAKYLLAAIEWDHREHDGRHHMHDGQQIPEVHEHGETQNKYDFVATGREIQSFMFTRFFDQLANIRETGPIVFAELAGGRGQFSDDNPLAANDYSYKRIVDGLNSGEFGTGWIDHLLMVIHPASSYSDRVAWNHDRLLHPPSENDIRAGRASWGVPKDVMQNTVHDDFVVFQSFLELQGVHPSHIETIHNSGGREFFNQAMEALERNGVGLSEGQGGRKELR